MLDWVIDDVYGEQSCVADQVRGISCFNALYLTSVGIVLLKNIFLGRKLMNVRNIEIHITVKSLLDNVLLCIHSGIEPMRLITQGPIQSYLFKGEFELSVVLVLSVSSETT